MHYVINLTRTGYHLISQKSIYVYKNIDYLLIKLNKCHDQTFTHLGSISVLYMIILYMVYWPEAKCFSVVAMENKYVLSQMYPQRTFIPIRAIKCNFIVMRGHLFWSLRIIDVNSRNIPSFLSCTLLRLVKMLTYIEH